MRHARGETLIELLVAFSIISSGLLAVMGLVFSNRTLAQANEDQVVGTDLAREGIEIVRDMRDSNWLNSLPMAGAAGGNVPGTVLTFNTMTPLWSGLSGQTPSMDTTANDFSSPDTKIVALTGANAGFLANANAANGITGTATAYQRLITLDAICDAGATNPDGTPKYAVSGNNTCASGVRVGLDVKAEVRWTRSNVAHSVVIYNDLYDWR